MLIIIIQNLLLLLVPLTQMAMITILILGTPNLGNSLVKAVQRITGVMIGALLQTLLSLLPLFNISYSRSRTELISQSTT